jgi:hypothetical protein
MRCCCRQQRHERAPLAYPREREWRAPLANRLSLASRHKRASGACSLRASALVEAVVRAGRRCPSQGGDDRRRPPNRALLLSPTSARQRARRRTIGFVLRTTRGWRVLGRHSDRDRTSSAGPWWRARERLCIGSRAFLHPAVPALHSATSASRTHARTPASTGAVPHQSHTCFATLATTRAARPRLCCRPGMRRFSVLSGACFAKNAIVAAERQRELLPRGADMIENAGTDLDQWVAASNASRDLVLAAAGDGPVIAENPADAGFSVWSICNSGGVLKSASDSDGSSPWG